MVNGIIDDYCVFNQENQKLPKIIQKNEGILFGLWFLENIMDINQKEAIISLCDGPRDQNIDALLVDMDLEVISFFQFKKRAKNKEFKKSEIDSFTMNSFIFLLYLFILAVFN